MCYTNKTIVLEDSGVDALGLGNWCYIKVVRQLKLID